MTKLDQIQAAFEELNNTPVEELYTGEFWAKVENNLKNEQEKFKNEEQKYTISSSRLHQSFSM